MPKRTEIVCLHEGKKDSIDPIFANAFIKAYKPSWLRGTIRFVPCGGKTTVLERFPAELCACARQGAATTLIVLADVDDDCNDCEELKSKYRKRANECEISSELFNNVIFIFSKDRIENWIEFIITGATDENKEGPRVKAPSIAAMAGKELAARCHHGNPSDDDLPSSLRWSCHNWRTLVERMR